MTRARIQHRRVSRGFSIVELMVAMAVGLMLFGAVVAIYLGTSQATRFQAAVQGVQESGRFALDLVARNLRQAGYDDPFSALEVDEPVLMGTTTPAGALIALGGLKSGVGTVGVRYEGGDQIRDCLGAPVAVNTYATSVYGVNTANQLVCGTSTSNVTPVVDGIEDLRLRYGIDPDGDELPNRYVEAGEVSDWNQVVTVEILVLASSTADALPGADTVCLGCTVFSGVADRRIRAEFRTVVGIRNAG